jgi:hypothetical protein
MGFFSWNCVECGHPMLSPMAVNDVNEWMSRVTVIAKDGSILKGEYDGYGRVNGRELDWQDDPQCYHDACWQKAGKPTEYTTPSENANDQGWFYDEGAHDMAEPAAG